MVNGEWLQILCVSKAWLWLCLKEKQSEELIVEECDATIFNRSTIAGNTRITLYKLTFRIMCNRKVQCLVIVFIACISNISAQSKQWVEGFDTVVFHYNVNRNAASRDFRGMARGLMTAGWWAEGQMKNNTLSWKTAPVPAKQPTTFSFIGATCVLPYELSRGPLAKLGVNGKYALTFTLGFNKDFVWREGEYELRYISKRVEYPYFSSHRELELNGNSGIFQLSVPASDVDAGVPVTLQQTYHLLKDGATDGLW